VILSNYLGHYQYSIFIIIEMFDSLFEWFGLDSTLAFTEDGGQFPARKQREAHEHVSPKK